MPPTDDPSVLPSPLVDGFYWVRLGDRMIIAERTSWTSALGEEIVDWALTGSEDTFRGDARLEIVAGPVGAPNPADAAPRTLAALSDALERALSPDLAGDLRGMPREAVTEAARVLFHLSAVAKTSARPHSAELEAHRARHLALHESLDELLGDYLDCTGAHPSERTILDLVAWSFRQTFEPEKPNR